ncbi:FAD-dependent monooxygenase [Actinomadura harenae]|uniref:FAD-binding monooxygenase n=1 Tax=Actinomadura harenae TaxID=2483351 RepID=A0A3M2M0I2_9ACTN|nr:FAD-dependent monooxygenase [Actinomadura harenae]RMI43161.1 FAD-binding monooxygenase [Actinomadura harenae]
MADLTTDFCIVGGGPAGLTLALLLVRSGARVVVLERSRSLDRDYRGEILQPGGQALLDALGVLDPALAAGGYAMDRFQLVEHGRTLIDADYRGLPGPFGRLLSLPQRHVLEELLAQCGKFEEFVHLGGCRAVRLLGSGGRVEGVEGDRAAGSPTVHAHCVIGADGRYSKVRRLAGIEAGRLDVFDQDVLWFRLPLSGPVPREVRIFRAGGNPVITYPSYPDSLQVGWTLPHGRYRALAEAGVGELRERIARAMPPYADLVRASITSARDLTLLDVFAGDAAEWARDGLVLIGDSAHTHSPIGAQGINLAIQDAVALHGVLLDSLRRRDATARFFEPYVRDRRRTINRITRIQIMQSKAMLSTGRLGGALRPRIAGLVSRTPAYRRVFDTIAFGDRTIQVPG